MYNLPWIINNMILEPKEITKSKRPSELELKVQRSLQKLPVPDWYANKSIASPKIISDRRPFEIRPAPWKDPARNRKLLNNSCKKSVENTVVVKPVVDNKKMPHLKCEKLDEVMKTSNVKSAPSYSSKTFPKMSPSRKIQNINLVFPTTTTSQETLVKSINDKVTPEMDSLDKSIASIDSIGEFTPQKMSTLEDIPASISESISIKTSTVRALAFPEKGKISRMNCLPPAVPKKPLSMSSHEKFNFQNQNLLTPKKLADTEKILVSPVAKLTNTASLTPQKSGRISRMNCPAPTVPVTPAKTYKNQSNYFEQSSISENVFLTPKKSTEMENIIKNEQKRSSGKSFVEEIIQELNAKCQPKVKSSYTSPTSKNFVKKLVRALEMGCSLKRDDDDTIFESCNDIDYNSETSTVSISNKDSDSGSSSDSELKSSASNTSKDSTFLSFSMALENRRSTCRQTIIPYVDDENESVYWIPLPNCKLPRTSSLKNIMSNVSSQGGTSSPISSSPDSDALRDPSLSRQSTNLQNFPVSGWGKTFDKRNSRSRQLFRIGETTIIDSGYSDRSETSSSDSSSSLDESCYNDSETTQTASEISEDYGYNYPRQTRRPKIPAHIIDFSLL